MEKKQETTTLSADQETLVPSSAIENAIEEQAIETASTLYVSQNSEEMGSASLIPQSFVKTLQRTSILPEISKEKGAERPQFHFTAKPRYDLQKHLGEGAAGVVELADDTDIQRKVALKKLKAVPEDSSLVLRFIDEIRMVGQLEHQNIVPIHDVGIDEDGTYFFVMKYVDGETLESIIKKLTEGKKECETFYDNSEKDIFLFNAL